MSTDSMSTDSTHVAQVDAADVVTSPKASGTSSGNTRVTWVQRFHRDSQAADFDVKKWAGKLAFERLQTAKRAIHSIGTPFFSTEVDLPISDKLTNAIGEALEAECEKLLDEMSRGKRSTNKISGCLEI